MILLCDALILSLVFRMFLARNDVTKHSSTARSIVASCSRIKVYLASSTLQVTDSATTGLLNHRHRLLIVVSFLSLLSTECCLSTLSRLARHQPQAELPTVIPIDAIL